MSKKVTPILVALSLLCACNVDEEFSSEEKTLKVFEYQPAPGQFIGESSMGFSGSEKSVADALLYAQKRLESGSLISLGGFGGYITVGFSEPIANGSSYDLAVRGNGIPTSSEPGIVYVMRDTNGNGLPDDTWYELAGSDTDADGSQADYSVTYFRPTAERQSVKWIDSNGVEGSIEYLESQHNQPSYYPTWISAESYTLTGRVLKKRNYFDNKSGQWIQPPYEWGYVDNFTDKDWVPSDRAVNMFDISNAIDKAGRGVELEYIDFIKIQCAVNGTGGQTGEISTELSEIYPL